MQNNNTAALLSEPGRPAFTCRTSETDAFTFHSLRCTSMLGVIAHQRGIKFASTVSLRGHSIKYHVR